MTDPVAGLREMARVTRAGGVVAACVWDLAGGESPLSVFWNSAKKLDPDAIDESRLAGAREGHLAELFDAAGLGEVGAGVVSLEVEHASFDEWWEPFTLGVGPAGGYLATRDDAGRAAVRELSREVYGDGPFTLSVRAWAARGVA